MSTTLEHIQYGFDRDSRRTWQKRPLSTTQDQSYQYDALSQVHAAARGSLNTNLTAISGTPTLAESWAYDPTGNWRGYEMTATGATPLDQHRVHDRGNRMTQIEGNPHNQILDRAGRMRQMAPDAEGDWDGKLELTWDAWSRITKVRNNGEVVGEYTYDGAHRRVTREVEEETLHSYYNDAWRPVEERRDEESTASMSYLWGSRHRDDLVRRDRAVGGTTLNETRYILMDYFNPAAITDGAGVVTERYAFSAFGVRTTMNPDFTVRGSSECGMEFSFQGQFVDSESGLLNYGYRYYSPYLGRWTCKDPIVEEGGLNLYEVVGNGAVNRVDHLGLDSTYGMMQHFFGGVIIPYPHLQPPATVVPPETPAGTIVQFSDQGEIRLCCENGKVVAASILLTGENSVKQMYDGTTSGMLLRPNAYSHYIPSIPKDTRAGVCCTKNAIRFTVNKQIRAKGVDISWIAFDSQGNVIGNDAKFGGIDISQTQFLKDALKMTPEDYAKIRSIIDKGFEALSKLCPK